MRGPLTLRLLRYRSGVEIRLKPQCFLTDLMADGRFKAVIRCFPGKSGEGGKRGLTSPQRSGILPDFSDLHREVNGVCSPPESWWRAIAGGNTNGCPHSEAEVQHNPALTQLFCSSLTFNKQT